MSPLFRRPELLSARAADGSAISSVVSSPAPSGRFALPVTQRNKRRSHREAVGRKHPNMIACQRCTRGDGDDEANHRDPALPSQRQAPAPTESLRRKPGLFTRKWHSGRSLPNEVSDGSQPPLTVDLSPTESAGSRSLHHLGRPVSGSDSGPMDSRASSRPPSVMLHATPPACSRGHTSER